MAVWTNKQKAFFRERWDAGDSYDEIADAMAARGWPIRSARNLSVLRIVFGFPIRSPERSRVDHQTGERQASPWTEERTALLRQLHGTLTFNQIARQLGGGLTRNAVIGKAKRLGLPPLPPATVKLHHMLAVRQRPTAPRQCAPAAPRYRPPPKPKPVRVKPTDPQAQIVAALLGQCAAAEARRQQYRSQPNGALRAR